MQTTIPVMQAAGAESSGASAGEGKPGEKPTVSYWHLWTDAEGVSHQKQCALTTFELKGVGGAAPQWNNKHPEHPSTVVVTVQPVGWVGDWHENPAPQWIIVLSGQWWIESMDGTRIEQGPGEFSFGEDQGLHGERGRPKGTSLGHDRRPACRADDGAIAYRSAARALPHKLSQRWRGSDELAMRHGSRGVAKLQRQVAMRTLVSCKGQIRL